MSRRSEKHKDLPRNVLYNGDGRYIYRSPVTCRKWSLKSKDVAGLRKEVSGMRQEIFNDFYDEIQDHVRRDDGNISPDFLHVTSHIVANAFCVTTFDIPPKLYFLIRGDKIVYVGKTTDLLSRLRTHIVDEGKDFDRYWHFTPENLENLDLLEVYYIMKYQPEYNKVTGRIPTKSRKPKRKAQQSISLSQ